MDPKSNPKIDVNVIRGPTFKRTGVRPSPSLCFDLIFVDVHLYGCIWPYVGGCTVPYRTVLYCTVLYCTVLYCMYRAVLLRTVPYCTMYCAFQRTFTAT